MLLHHLWIYQFCNHNYLMGGLFAFGDLGAAVAALTGLGAGGYMGYRRLDRQACMMQFIPTVSARIGPAGPAGPAGAST